MSDEPLKTLEISLDQGWLQLRLNRPEARNALSDEMVSELLQLLETVAQRRDVRGITIRGNGGVFCAGGDLKGFKSGFQDNAADLARIEAASERAGELFERINTMPQVVLMLVEGAAMAGGLGMVCAGDVVAVTKSAKFALTEVTLGIPPAQIAPYVVGRLGLASARRLMLTAARFDGGQAQELGLADYVVEDAAGLEQIEAEVQASVRRCAPGAIAATKALVLASGTQSGAEMRRTAAQSFARCMASDEAREGIAAFVEKRKPHWAENA